MSLQDEILKIKLLMEQTANKDMKKLLLAYKKMLDEVRDEVGGIYLRYSNDEGFNISKRNRIRELKKLEKSLIDKSQNIGVVDVAVTTGILTKIYQETYYRSAFALDKGVDIRVDFKLLRPEFIKAAIEIPIEGKMFSSRIWDNKDKLVKRLRWDIEKAMRDGTGIEKLARDIKKDFGSSAYESKRLIHTELARVQSEAQDEIYKASGVVNKVMYDATLDQKTSEICQGLDGNIFDAKSDYPKPPQHPNCRSAIIPIIPGWQPTKKRENIKTEDGKAIIDYANYETWKKTRGIN